MSCFSLNWQFKVVNTLKNWVLGVSRLRAKTPLRLDNFGKNVGCLLFNINKPHQMYLPFFVHYKKEDIVYMNG